MATDPICGMEVDEETGLSVQRDGKPHYFCSEHCRDKFVREHDGQSHHKHAHDEHASGEEAHGEHAHEEHAHTEHAQDQHSQEQAAHGECCHAGGESEKQSASGHEGSESHTRSAAKKPEGRYFCPMCEGVTSDKPGDCPKCGMALESPQGSQVSRETVYTCPMHPEVEQSEPGECPKCGMELEPKSAAKGEEDDAELKSMTRRFYVSLVFGVPVFLIAMLPMVGVPVESWLGPAAFRWSQLILATPVVLWCGLPFFKRGWRSVVNRQLNMFTLIALGTGAAYFYSVFAVLLPGLIPEAFRHAGEVNVYFEAAAMITALVLLGQVLELRARKRTGSAVRELLELAPPQARLVTEDGTKMVSLDDVKQGDILRIRPGEKVPVDGEVTEGTTHIDESMISGEPEPVPKEAGDSVIGGTLNGTGSFEMRADRVGDDTVLSQIVSMVAEAQRTRAPIQRVADVAASYFVPAVVTVAVVTFLVWAIWQPAQPALAYAFVNAVAVLIVACPCALGLATPMSIMVGVGRGAKEGVLVREAEVLERFEKIDMILVDKTGTLTEGRPKVTTCRPAENFSEEELLKFAGSVEQNSEHPLGAAIVEAAGSREIALADASEFDSITGAGVQATVEGKTVVVGSVEYIARSLQASPAEASTSEQEGGGGEEEGGGGGGNDGNASSSADAAASRESSESVAVSQAKTSTQQITKEAEELQQEGHTVMLVTVDGEYAGLLAVSDPIKESTPEAVRALHDLGLKIAILTGDNEATAKSIARQLNIDEVAAGLSPDEKLQQLHQWQERGNRVAMAGDGVNDAPALAAASVGIAMGSGTDVAIESAGITLVRGDLRGIVKAVRLSRSVMRNIRQNLFFAFVYNSLGVPIAAGVLYPLSEDLLLNPMVAAAAMSFSSVSVIGNALRLRSTGLELDDS